MTGPAVWSGPVLRLGGGRVLLGGSALLDVVRALEAAQRITARDGYRPSPQWRELLSLLRAELGESTSRVGSAEVPQLAEVSAWSQETVSTAQAAELLGCGARNVRDLAARGVLTRRLLGGRMRFDRDEIVAEQLRRSERGATDDQPADR